MKHFPIGEVIAGVTGSAFIATVVYLFGYSSTLRLNLFLYFGLNDYLRLAVEWLPPVLVAWLFGAMLNEYFKRLERGLTEDEIVATSSNPRKTSRFRDLADRAFPVLIVVMAISDTVLYYIGDMPRERVFLTWGAAAPLLWLASVNWYVRVPRLAARVASVPGKYLGVVVIPMFLLGTFFYGVYSGVTGDRLLLPTADVVITLTDGSGGTCGRILFAPSDLLVFRHARDSTVTVYATDSVREIEHVECPERATIE